MVTAKLLIVPALAAFASAQDLASLKTVPARPILEETSEALEGIGWDDLVYGRELHMSVPAKMKRAYDAVWRPIRRPPGGGFDKKELIGLLRDENPRLRTLAAIVLFQSEDPKMLPHIATLLQDGAKTIPSWKEYVGRAIPDPFHGDPWKDWHPNYEPDTVAAGVTRMLRFYTHRVGHYTLDDKWEDYWTPREKRKWCTSWYHTRLCRISGGTSPMPSLPRYGPGSLQALRAEIHALPQPDRDWVELALFSTWEGMRFVTPDSGLASDLCFIPEKDLIFAARRRGRAALLKLLGGTTPIGDPDMPHYRQGIVRFVLNHADELLDEDDADTLVQLAKTDISGKLAMWFTAAARVAPKRAGNILRSQLPNVRKLFGDQRREMVSCLWRLAGREHVGFVVEWFYGDEHVVLGRPPRATFLDGVMRRYKTDDRKLLKRLIEDKRFEKLDSQTTRSFVLNLNRVLPQRLVSDEEIRRLWHPYGLSHFDKRLEKAKREHPGPTKSLLATLATWRKRIRAAVPFIVKAR